MARLGDIDDVWHLVRQALEVPTSRAATTTLMLGRTDGRMENPTDRRTGCPGVLGGRRSAALR